MARPSPSRTRERARSAARAPEKAPGQPGALAAVAPLAPFWALTLLLYACRGGLAGVAVADDYVFLAHRQFHQPLDWFGSMGAAFYWRPFARQLWFSLVGPWLVEAPWAAAALHAAMLAGMGVLLYRIAIRGTSPWVAAALSTTPLLAEAARTWYAWPSAAQHLLAMLGATLAVHEAVAGRRWTAALAGLAGTLSHENALFVLAALPLAAWMPQRSGAAARAQAVPVAIALALWAAGYGWARAHGLTMPPGGIVPARLPAAFAHVAVAFVNGEDLLDSNRRVLFIAQGALLAAAALFALRPASRARLRRAWPAALGCALVGLAATVPLATLLPDWNAWRASMPQLAFGLAAGVLFAAIEPRLLAVFVLLRAGALLLAPLPAKVIGPLPPPSESDLSYTRITRLQLVAKEIRTELRRNHPTLPRGATVYTLSFPTMIEVGLQTQLAAEVWYGDSTLVWRRFGGLASYETLPDVLLGMNPELPDRPVVEVVRRSAETTRAAIHAYDAGQFARADSLFLAAEDLQPRILYENRGTALVNRAMCRLQLGELVPAESLALRGRVYSPGSGDAPGLLALIEYNLQRHDQALAFAREALAKNPRSQLAQEAAKVVGLLPGGPSR